MSRTRKVAELLKKGRLTARLGDRMPPETHDKLARIIKPVERKHADAVKKMLEPKDNGGE